MQTLHRTRKVKNLKNVNLRKSDNLSTVRFCDITNLMAKFSGKTRLSNNFHYRKWIFCKRSFHY